MADTQAPAAYATDDDTTPTDAGTMQLVERTMYGTTTLELEYADCTVSDDSDRAMALAELMLDHAEQHLGAKYTRQRQLALCRMLQELASSDHGQPAGQRLCAVRELQVTLVGRRTLWVSATSVCAMQYAQNPNRCLLDASYSLTLGERGGMATTGMSAKKVKGRTALYHMQWKR